MALLPLKKRLSHWQQEKQVNWEVVELDYALSWVLVAIGTDQAMQNSLIFKGGTCLKKSYFGQDYRYSQDLDFTVAELVTDQFLDTGIARIVSIASDLSMQNGTDIKFIVEPYKEKNPHPFDQKAYVVRAKFPWQPKSLTKIKLEISRQEIMVYPTQFRSLLHEYGENFEQQIQTYALEEIIAEKYRGILQNQRYLQEKSWIRSRVRDFYDLWRILNEFKSQLILTDFVKNFKAKCSIKNINFSSADQFFSNEVYLAKVSKDWEQYLSQLVTELPSFSELLARLKRLTYEIF